MQTAPHQLHRAHQKHSLPHLSRAPPAGLRVLLSPRQGHHCHFRLTEVDAEALMGQRIGLQLQSHSDDTKPLTQSDSTCVQGRYCPAQDPVVLPTIPAPALTPPACSPSHGPSVGAASPAQPPSALAKAAAGARDFPPPTPWAATWERAEASAALSVGSP